jgi:large subunit ribosomal protein L7/L12
MTTSALEKLKKQRNQLDARIQALETRNKASERKKDTHRKILLGSYYLEQARKNNQLENIKDIMNTYLKRNTDRILFDLPKLQEEKRNT